VSLLSLSRQTIAVIILYIETIATLAKLNTYWQLFFSHILLTHLLTHSGQVVSDSIGVAAER
jgi:hypothetical protein